MPPRPELAAGPRTAGGDTEDPSFPWHPGTGLWLRNTGAGSGPGSGAGARRRALPLEQVWLPGKSRSDTVLWVTPACPPLTISKPAERGAEVPAEPGGLEWATRAPLGLPCWCLEQLFVSLSLPPPAPPIHLSSQDQPRSGPKA